MNTSGHVELKDGMFYSTARELRLDENDNPIYIDTELDPVPVEQILSQAGLQANDYNGLYDIYYQALYEQSLRDRAMWQQINNDRRK